MAQLNERRPVRPGGKSDEVVKLAALGDLMLVGEWEESLLSPSSEAAFTGVAPILDAHDIVFANLETTLEGGSGQIAKEPRVVGRQAVLQKALSSLHVDIVNLANNHTFDCFLDGFDRVRELLAADRIQYFGAGGNLGEASRPCLVEARGIRFGWLGYVSRDTKPSHVATGTHYGVRALARDAALDDVGCLKAEVDHVIVSLHWGVEFSHIPAPSQVAFARSLIDAGASLVVGHHAHVIQGVERYKSGVIAYNLGNLTTTALAIGSRLAIRQTRRTRSSLMLSADFTRKAVGEVKALPVRCDRGTVFAEDTHAARILARANRRLAKGISPASWRARRVFEDAILRSLWKLDPRVIGTLRPQHLVNFLHNLQGRGPL